MGRDRDNTYDNIKILFKLIEWDRLTDRELDLIGSFQQYFLDTCKLSDRQFEILNDIFDRASAR